MVFRNLNLSLAIEGMAAIIFSKTRYRGPKFPLAFLHLGFILQVLLLAMLGIPFQSLVGNVILYWVFVTLLLQRRSYK